MSELDHSENTLRLSNLLREYIQNVRIAQNEADEVIAAFVSARTQVDHGKQHVLRLRFAALKDYITTLNNGSIPLLRKVSQWVEHGQAGEVECMELNLRLVDLQAMLQRAVSTVMNSVVQ